MWARNALAKWVPFLKAPPRSGSDFMSAQRAVDIAWLHKCLTSPAGEDGNTSGMADKDLEDVVSQLVMQRTLEMFKMLRANTPPSFGLEARTSGLGSAAGDGLFVTARALQPGEIVALYPGTVFFAEELEFFGGVSGIFRDEETSHFIVRNADGVLIDGLGKTLPLKSGSGALAPSDGGDNEGSSITEMLDRIQHLTGHDGISRPCKSSSTANAYAMAHKANHPPPGTPANVIPVPVDFDLAMLKAEGLCEFLPTSFALEPTAGESLLCEHSICFVASRTIRPEEEVWLDYRTNPDSRPQWYVDAERVPYEN